MENLAKIFELRHLLAERFPQAIRQPGARLATGVPAFDELLEGGLPRSALTELVAAPGAGSGLVIRRILEKIAQSGQWLALIDGRDGFDPQPFDQAVLDHLLWLRCPQAASALRCADLLLRDGNLPLVILDLQQNLATELRKIPATAWYRFQRLAEESVVALLVITPRVLVSSAQVRLALRDHFALEALSETSATLATELTVELLRQPISSSSLVC